MCIILQHSGRLTEYARTHTHAHVQYERLAFSPRAVILSVLLHQAVTPALEDQVLMQELLESMTHQWLTSVPHSWESWLSSKSSRPSLIISFIHTYHCIHNVPYTASRWARHPYCIVI